MSGWECGWGLCPGVGMCGQANAWMQVYLGEWVGVWVGFSLVDSDGVCGQIHRLVSRCVHGYVGECEYGHVYEWLEEWVVMCGCVLRSELY